MLNKSQYQKMVQNFFCTMKSESDFMEKFKESIEDTIKDAFEREFKDENKNMLFTNSSLNKALKINKQLEDASEACGIYGRWLAEMVAEQKCPNIQAVGKFNNSNVYRFGLEKK